MAKSGKEKFPNLKISIDNAGDSSEGELEEEMQVEEAFSWSEGEDEENADSLGGVSLTAKNEKKRQEKTQTASSRKQDVKRYENKSGDFVTGIDVVSKEARVNKEKRAKRFGLEKSTAETDLDLKKIYDSLGIVEKNLEKDERGIRLDAVHLRGTDHMSTKDVFDYFREYAPGSIEWIDDRSCNVVWFDKITAARAMLNLSGPVVEKDDEPKEEEQHKEKQETDDDNTQDSVPAEDEKTSTSPMETDEESEDDDELDLCSNEDSDADTKKLKKTSRETSGTRRKDKKSRKETKATSTTAKSQSNLNQGKAKDPSVKSSTVAGSSPPVEKTSDPPGWWRLGIQHPKAKKLFLRFATKADKKMPGAERKSQYYKKYGNPNYGGMKGLISSSRKRKMRGLDDSSQKTDDDLNPRGSKSQDNRGARFHAGRELVSYADLDDPEMGPFADIKVDTDNDAKVSKSYADEDADEMEQQEESVYSDEEYLSKRIYQRLGPPAPCSDDEDDQLVDEEELQQLLAPPPPKRTMRMYADDVEEDMRKHRLEVSKAASIGRQDDDSSRGQQTVHQRLGAAPSTDLRNKLMGRRTRVGLSSSFRVT